MHKSLLCIAYNIGLVFFLYFNPIHALLYYFCLINTATVYMYVCSVILDVSVILLWEFNTVGEV